MASADPLSQSEKRTLTRLRRQLLIWSEQQGRTFPWRRDGATVYEKIVVEVLLQRTTAQAVGKFHHAFFTRFPNWAALATAIPEDLETFLKPLGLWRRRAVSLLGLARYALSVDGRFPPNPIEHASIPAVGQYVSNAIMMFQHGRPRPLLDVNMARVIERYVKPRKLADIRYDPWLQAAAHWFARGRQAETANWAILDFAALVCRARKPLCGTCPVRSSCAFAIARKSSAQESGPSNPQSLAR
jgi:A/G-specific adenine glycosylase